ncbi:MAG: hypothetical protein KAS67_07995 [Thermoplasmata archaeon]|nr:hypothetical protein [Thermoplasmata archaeon]
MDEEPKIELETTPEPPAPAAEPVSEVPPAQPTEPAEPAQEAEPAPPAEAAAAPAKGGGSGLIIAIVVIAVVAVVVIAFTFMGGGSIEGKWTFESVEVLNADGTVNQTITDAFNEDNDEPWMEFKSDSTALMGNATSTNDMDATWDTNDGKLTITSTYIDVNSDYNVTTGNITWNNETVTDTQTYTYSISGSTLTLEFVDEGMTFKITAKKA